MVQYATLLESSELKKIVQNIHRRVMILILEVSGIPLVSSTGIPASVAAFTYNRQVSSYI